MVTTGQGDVVPLERAGVQVVIRKGPYIHAKAIVADGRVVFIGSENLSSTSLDQNREMGLMLAETAAINAVETALAADWQGVATAVIIRTRCSSPNPWRRRTAVPRWR
jgi:phosphatidylserine/phosphatidylglycerophosphate/cardiolipin synthase-like enzyme